MLLSGCCLDPRVMQPRVPVPGPIGREGPPLLRSFRPRMHARAESKRFESVTSRWSQGHTSRASGSTVLAWRERMQAKRRPVMRRETCDVPQRGDSVATSLCLPQYAPWFDPKDAVESSEESRPLQGSSEAYLTASRQVHSHPSPRHSADRVTASHQQGTQGAPSRSHSLQGWSSAPHYAPIAGEVSGHGDVLRTHVTMGLLREHWESEYGRHYLRRAALLGHLPEM